MLMSGSMLLASSASAFSDVEGQDAKITESLQKKGIIQGITAEKFAPRSKLTGAQGVYMAVHALGLTPKDNGGKKGKGKAPWYTTAQKIAEDHGIKLPDDFKWTGEITKEQFAYILDQAISATGNYPMIKMYIDVADADQGNALYSGSIQRLLLMKITELDKDRNFQPKASMMRIEAARMVYKAAEFVEAHKDDTQQVNDNVSFKLQKVNDEVNKVELTRHDQPNPGYGIRVAKIEFTEQKKAVVHYELTSPKPDSAYAQVITDSKTETYVPSSYTVEIAPLK